MKNHLKSIFFALLFVISGSSAFAANIVAANLTYKCLGGGQYRLRLHLYADCGAIAPINSQLIDISSSMGCVMPALTLQLVGTPTDVSPSCSAAVLNCNGTNSEEVKLYTYENTITLPLNCGDWTFSWWRCCRGVGITNLSTLPNGGNIYIEAFLSGKIANSGQCNSSPSYTNTSTLFIPAGKPFSYTPGAIDEDGDLLVFSLVNPLGTSINDSLSYSSPAFNSNCPLVTQSSCSTILCNKMLGGINFTPMPGMNQKIVVTMLVKEFRQGELVGSSMCDIQINVLSAALFDPIVVGLPTNVSDANTGMPIPFYPDGCGGGSFVVCGFVPFTFNISAASLDTSTVINLGTNLGTAIPGSASIPSGTNPYISLFFVDGVNQTSSFLFSFYDNACPFRNKTIVYYQVYRCTP